VRKLAEKVKKATQVIGQNTHDQCAHLRDNVIGVPQKLADRGVNIFDQDYKEIAGSNPKRYTTAYDGQCDGELTRLYDDLLREAG
jgi:methyl-accepting chemotaxis protein